MNNPDKNKEPVPATPDKEQPGKESPAVQPPPDKPEIEPIPEELPERDNPHKPADPQAHQEQAFKRNSPDKS